MAGVEDLGQMDVSLRPSARLECAEIHTRGVFKRITRFVRESCSKHQRLVERATGIVKGACEPPGLQGALDRSRKFGGNQTSPRCVDILLIRNYTRCSLYAPPLMQPNILSQGDTQRAAQLVGDCAALFGVISKTVEFGVSSVTDAITCTVTLPDERRLSSSAACADAAARRLMVELAGTLFDECAGGRWLSKCEPTSNVNRTKEAEVTMQTEAEICTVAPSRTKERQDTIGVSSKKSLRTAIHNLAAIRGESLAPIARELAEEGFEQFEARSFSENPRKILDGFEAKLCNLEGHETEQWMVRLSRHLSIRIKLAAKEYGKSASQLVAMCMVEALATHQALAQRAATDAELVLARAAVGKVRGPAARRLAEDVGLGKHVVLLNGVLSGKIEAPRRLLGALSSKFEVSVVALSQVFSESLQLAPLPAYKAEDCKPHVRLVPQAWEDAVRSLRLSDDEISALLGIKD